MPDGLVINKLMDKIHYPAEEKDNIPSILIGDKMSNNVSNLYPQETLDVSRYSICT